jgi:hypothetical protein
MTRGPLFVWAFAAIGAVLALAACRTANPTLTGLRVLPQWDDVEIDQIEVSVTGPEGARLVDGERRPERPQRLTPGADLVILLHDDLRGQAVRCRVWGLREGKAVAVGETEVELAAGGLTTVEVRLLPPPPGVKPPVGRDGGAVLPPPGGPVGKANGESCAAAADCRSGHCADGVCCDSACDGTCQACNVPGRGGSCSFAPLGSKHRGCRAEAPAGCGLDGTCDGAGACRKYPSGTRCAPGTCAAGSITGVGTCDGMGTCVTGQTEVCAPFNCDPSGPEPKCLSSCQSSTDCVAGRNCVQSSCGKKYEGAPCAGGLECASGFCAQGVCCDAACDGQCVACNQPGSQGTCRPLPAGILDPRGACMDQGAASCGTTGACDGKGGCAVYASGTVCRAAACTSGTLLQTAGRCDGAGRCATGSTLSCTPYACANGACNAQCTADAHCAPGRTCDLARRSCGRKGLGQACTEATQCESGHCVDGVCCSDACTGPCRSCSAGSPGRCTMVASGLADPRGVCINQGAQSCGNDGTCNGAGGCRRYAAGTVCGPGRCSTTQNARILPSTCDGAGRCVAGAAVPCAPYRCNGDVCFVACASDANCVAPNVCIGGTCTRKPVGSTCTAANQCATGNCVDGVCCQAMTCGTCRACNVPGSVGTCAPVGAGQPDPRGGCTAQAPSTCGNDGVCDGAGACRKHAAGTQCASAACKADGVTLALASSCDGKGACVPGGDKPCTPFACDGTSRTCKTTCGGAGDCAGGYACNSGQTCGDYKAAGQACSAGAECVTGHCVDGVCCTASACGSCRSCSAGQGTCAPVPAGSNDPRGMCTASSPSTCGNDGKCDGNGACRKHAAGTVCAAGACAGGTATPPSTCDGQGMCQPPSSTLACGAYACSGGVCAQSCSSDADCAAPNTCVGSTCQLRPLGTACMSGAQCASGHCTHGVCCEAASCGPCRACNLAGSAGVCQPVPAGTADAACAADAASTCQRDGKCDGAGACRLHVAGTVCAPATCASTATETAPSTCDGAGTCVGGAPVACAPYRCDATVGSCRSTCSSNAHCAPTSACVDGSCQ